MPNEIMITIKVKNESEEGYAAGLAEAKEFARKVKEELDKAGNLAIKVDAEEAKVKIKEVEEELARLNHDDASVKIKVKEEDVKATTDKVKKDLEDGLDDAGKKGGGRFSKGLKDAIEGFDFQPTGITVGLAVGAAFLPLIGASIAAAVVGSVGLGGIVGGVMIAAKDPRVKSAFQGMKKDLGDSLKLDAAPFVPVVVSALGQIQRTVKSLDLGTIFKDLAPQVQPVLSGILDLVGSLGRSIKNIVANSGPVLKELGTDFRNLGNTIEAAFNSLADNPQQEAQAFHDLFAVIDATITATFDLVNALTEVYGAFHKIIELSPFGFYELMQDHSQKVTGAVKDTVSAVLDNVDANNRLAASAQAAADADAAQAKAIKDTADALKAATDPAFALADAQKQVFTAQTNYNKAVKAGGENSAAAKIAQASLDKAYVNLVSALAAARGSTDHLTDAQKTMLRSAGASEKVIKDLDAQLRAAYNSAKKLDGFRVDVTVAYSYKTFGAPRTSVSPYDFHGLATGGIKGAATGATSSDWTWVGENGPELRKLPPGTAVKSHGDSMRAVSGGGAGGGETVVKFDKSSLTGLAAALMETLRVEIHARGGNVQTVLGS